MNIEEEKEKLDSIRQEFPVLRNIAYLNTGTCGPLPERTAQVMTRNIERQAQEGRADLKAYTREYAPLVRELREGFARLLGANRQEIALTHHTTEGMNVLAWGIDWQPGDEIITTKSEYSGGVLPFYSVAQRFGLKVHLVDVNSSRNVVEAIASKLSTRTRLVVVSHISYLNGALLPVGEIGRVAHQAGALMAVDGAQAAGVIPLNMATLEVDFYAIPGQKWLCGPEGAGALYVKGASG